MFRAISVRLVSIFVVAVSLGVGGCSSEPKGPQRKAKAVESLAKTRSSLADASKQVAATNESLRTVSSATEGNLRPAFTKYAENVKKTESMAEAARNRAKAMRERTAEYVDQWHNEVRAIQDPELRKASAKRAEGAKAEFERMRDVAEEARNAYEPYMTGLKDVQQYLTNDLTAGGVAAVKGKADDTIRLGETLQQKLTAVQTELDGLSQKWSSTLPGSGK